MDRAPRPNRRLRLQRRLRGWSQEDVAAGLYRVASSLGETDIGVDATMISRWERGTRHPRPRYVRLLSLLFDLPAEQLGLVQDADLSVVPLLPYDRVEGDADDRNEFIERVGDLLGGAPFPPYRPPETPGREPERTEAWERLDRALSRPGQLDVVAVEELERVTHALESLEPTAVSSRALLGPATGHLDAISMLLQASLRAGIRARLCSLAGETAGLVGWLRWNLNDAEGANACFRAGLRAAREADDQALGAYLVGAMACRLPGRAAPAITLRLLGSRTFGFAQADATPATAAWLAAKEADAWAQLGNEDECLRALARADEIVGRLAADPRRARPSFSMVDRDWLAGERGASLARLGRVDAAQSILQPVLASLGPTCERDRLWLLTALAGAHAESDEPEEACRHARAALVGAARMQLAPVLEAIGSLRTRLERHRRNLAVQELDEHLRSLEPLPSPVVAAP